MFIGGFLFESLDWADWGIGILTLMILNKISDYMNKILFLRINYFDYFFTLFDILPIWNG
jgi:hypothetical protein